MTVSEHTIRRAGRFTNYPAYSNRSENEVLTALEDALYLFLDLTHRSEDLGQVIDSLICDIAKTMLAKSGQEGVISAKDGEFERKWSDQNGTLDPALMARIKKYRQVVGANATPLA